MKKLYREKDDRLIAGVLGGFGRYFRIDATVLRAVFTLIVIFTAIIPGIFAYALLVFIIPERPSGYHDSKDEPDGPPFRPWR